MLKPLGVPGALEDHHKLFHHMDMSPAYLQHCLEMFGGQIQFRSDHKTGGGFHVRVSDRTGAVDVKFFWNCRRQFQKPPCTGERCKGAAQRFQTLCFKWKLGRDGLMMWKMHGFVWFDVICASFSFENEFEIDCSCQWIGANFLCLFVVYRCI